MAIELNYNAQGLSEMLGNTEDALSGTRAKMAVVQQKIVQRQEDIAHVDGQSEVQQELIVGVEAAIKAAEKALKHLRASAKVAQGTTLEESSAADVEAAERDLEFQRQLLVSHRADRASQQKRLAKDRGTAEKAIQKLEEELADLEEQERELTMVYQRTHRDLGLACYQSLAQQVQISLESEGDLKKVLHELRSERLALQGSLGQRLQEWPELAKKAEDELDSLGQEPKVSPTVQTIEVCIEYLRALVEHAPHLEASRGVNLNGAELLLSVPTDLVKIARFDSKSVAIFADRIGRLQQYLRELQMAENDRALFAPQGRRR